LNSGEDGDKREVFVLRRLGLGLLSALVVALIAMNVLAWSGVIIGEETATPAEAPVAEPSPPPKAGLSEEAIAREDPSKPLEKAKSGATTMILAATRGDCWVEVRAGSATGRALYSGTLASGSTLKFNRPKLWLRLGAASNVDIMVNGHPSTVPPGTVELTVPDA
jgi:uncharacterized iron-regulated membrane protein